MRMVNEAAGQYESQWATIASIATRIGGTAETLRRWARQHERDTGERSGASVTGVRSQYCSLRQILVV
jgi:transposase